jgi:hypothetical protein
MRPPAPLAGPVPAGPVPAGPGLRSSTRELVEHRWGGRTAALAARDPVTVGRANEPACRRGPVHRAVSGYRMGGHPSKRPTWGHRPGQPSPLWPCSGWGLPSRRGHPRRWCALTAPFHPHLWRPKVPIGGLFSVALSCGSPRLAVSQHPALRSPDLPRPPGVEPSSRDHPAGSLAKDYTGNERGTANAKPSHHLC